MPKIPVVKRSTPSWRAARASSGFTLIELVIVLVIVGIGIDMAIAYYGDSVDKRRNTQAKADIRTIETAITKFYVENSRYPDDLAEVFGSVPASCPKGQKTQNCDPWYTVYQYKRIVMNPRDSTKCIGCRLDGNMRPLNSDYDLWSNGKNKVSKNQVTAPDSLDDTIRVRNGRLIALGKDL